MKHRAISPLILLVAGMLSLAGTESRASYTLSTSVSNIAVNGVAPMTVNTITAPFMIGGQSVTASNGGVYFTDAAGSTIYIVNDSETATGMSNTVQESVYVSTTGSDSSLLTFTTNITASVNGVTGGMTFTQAMTAGSGFQFAISGGTGSVLYPTTSVTPTSMNINGTIITNTQTGGASGNPNSATAAAGISATFTATPAAVPEPASIAMLGLGLAGVTGFGLRRRASK